MYCVLAYRVPKKNANIHFVLRLHGFSQFSLWYHYCFEHSIFQCTVCIGAKVRKMVNKFRQESNKKGIQIEQHNSSTNNLRYIGDSQQFMHNVYNSRPKVYRIKLKYYMVFALFFSFSKQATNGKKTNTTRTTLHHLKANVQANQFARVQKLSIQFQCL